MRHGNDFRAWMWDPPWSRRGRFFGAGEVRIAILSLLAEKPRHGYELMKEMEARSAGSYRVSAGTIYPTLQQLEDEELIEATRQGGRRVFRLTEAGRAELAKDPEGVQRIWERAQRCEDWGQYMQPENFAVVGVHGPLAAVLRASLKAASHGHADRVRDILERARQELEQL